MGGVVEFIGKPKLPPLVYSCGDCGGQLFYVEANPQNDGELDGPYSSIHRCFKCGRNCDLYGLFYNTEEDV